MSAFALTREEAPPRGPVSVQRAKYPGTDAERPTLPGGRGTPPGGRGAAGWRGPLPKPKKLGSDGPAGLSFLTGGFCCALGAAALPATPPSGEVGATCRRRQRFALDQRASGERVDRGRTCAGAAEQLIGADRGSHQWQDRSG